MKYTLTKDAVQWIINKIKSHTSDKSNPHSVTKSQVGLGSVANYDQSKAIKSITRSGTTFTATALDGTTSTFTQQDNNTTYGVATESANGLLSAADKKKLDGIASGAQVNAVTSVAGRTGAVTISKSDVGLGNVDNTSDNDKHVLANNIKWGGPVINDGVSPIDAGISADHGANRLAFCNPAGITVEYSNDGGSSWTDYGASDSDKIKLVSGIDIGAFYIGKHNSHTTVTVQDQLRITIIPNKCNIYTQGVRLLLYVSTNGAGGSKVLLEKTPNKNYTDYSAVGTYSLGGWSGWNSIPIDFRIGGGNIGCGAFRLTFSISSLSTNTSYSNSFAVLQIALYGTSAWAINSNMAKNGHLYSYDYAQNATFPAQITATKFNGTATKATQDSAGQQINTTYIKNLSVSGKTVTYTKGDGTTGTISTQDTTYSAATTSAAGLMSATDKSKLDGIASGANKYSLPTASSSTLGGVKTGSNITNSSGTISLTKANVTSALGYTPPTTNTTYGVATTSANGLMSATDKAKLDSLRASVYETQSVPITGWTSRTINDTAYVQYSITLTNSYQYPSVKITPYPTGSNPAPTSAELTAFNSLVMYGVDDAGGKTLNLISEKVPETAYTVMITGRKYS